MLLCRMHDEATGEGEYADDQEFPEPKAQHVTGPLQAATGM